MIKSVSASNIYAAPAQNNKESFKRNYNQSPERGNTLADKAAWTGFQFAKGAMVSIVWDSIVNGIKLISKKGPTTTLPEMGRNAATFGLLWIAAGLVLDGFDKLFNSRHSQK